MARGTGEGKTAQARTRSGECVDLTVLDPPQVDEIWWTGVARDLGENRARLYGVMQRINQYEQQRRNADFLHESRVKLEARRDELKEIEKPFLAEWDRRGGWTRAYLVTNADGHVHRTRSCPTCHPTTQFAFMYDLSGKTEPEIIDAIGFKACTVCYPDAPSYPSFIQGQKDAEAAEAAKQANICSGSGQHVAAGGRSYASCPVCGESVSVTQTGKLRAHESRASKQAKLDADPKRITNPDGTPLRTSSSGEIKTLVTAQRELTNAFWWVLAYPDGNNVAQHRANADLIATAIAHKTGADKAELLVEHEKKAQKKLRRDRGF